jgi:murein DD-endopeptidase MepM/ murein hydrolase activator NlpD
MAPSTGANSSCRKRTSNAAAQSVCNALRGAATIEASHLADVSSIVSKWQMASRLYRRWLQVTTVFASALSAAFAYPAEPGPAAPMARYVLNYPAAVSFCPPVESYFEDVSEAIQQVRGKTIRHQLNGGYGLPVIDKVGDQNLLHLGADVAWQRTGDPVYAIANGVVRISAGPSLREETAKKEAATKNGKSAASKQPPMLSWGNLIVIEHRIGDDKYITSVYGHLAHAKFVAAGDVVQAGKMIGTIGRPGIENGGYKPHLHFAIREGRKVEVGAEIFTMIVNGKKSSIKVAALDEQEIEIEADESIPANFKFRFGDQEFALSKRDGKRFLPNAALQHVQRPDFAIVGYGLNTNGWRNPTEFLMEMRADTQPAPFGDWPAVQKKVPKKGGAKP